MTGLERLAGLEAAWAECERLLPAGYFISNVRHRNPTSRWCASATLDKDISGASYSGFGGTPVDALRDLAGKFRQARP